MSSAGIIWAIVGAVIGMAVDKLWGAFVLGCIGFLAGSVYDLTKRVALLEKQAQPIPAEHRKEAARPAAKPSPEPEIAPLPAMPEVFTEPATPAPTDASPKPDLSPLHQKPTPERKPPAYRQPVRQAPASVVSEGDGLGVRIIDYIKAFFVQGNVVVRIGLIVLFFGVAFLIKYAADRHMLPIEFRLMGVAVGAMAMLVVGWRLRLGHQAYAVTIQGGAVGILYLTVFAAAKMYTLLPMGLAFLLLVLMVALSATLALIQDAMPLALFGAIGGFFAPVLLSTGAGSHVALFSYYALLNAGILGIAWFKPWRILNLVGFAFTFVIGMMWGYKYYRPESFATTEPFLILFFVFYAAISIFYALRQPVNLKGFIDGPLVFGLPLVAFGLQIALVWKYQYGAGYSAIVLGAFYMILAKILWNRKIEGMGALTEAFLSMSVVFASLAIPLSLDSTWTSGLWALEGAGLVWIGLRQQRVLARCFGLLLQFGAGVSFIFTLHHSHQGIFALNGTYMSCLIISIAGLISNLCHQKFKDRLSAWEKYFHWGLLAWGLAWWFGGGISEIDSHVVALDRSHALLAFIAVSCWGMGQLSLGIDWPDMQYPAMGLSPAAIVIFIDELASGNWAHPFYHFGAVAWAAALAGQYHLLRRFEPAWGKIILRGLHQLTFHLAVFVFAWESAWVLGRLINGADTWKLSGWCGLPALIAVLMPAFAEKISWPVKRFLPDYTAGGLTPLMGYLWFWTLYACAFDGNPKPLGYLPILNPLEIIQIFALLTILMWQKAARRKKIELLAKFPPHTISVAVAASAFLGFNAVLARSVHYLTGTAYDVDALFDSVVFQAGISIFWALAALGIMVGAARKLSRKVWFCGATLLGITVVKLFVIDLEDIGTVARIVSFMVVGILMLVIGYFSPLPPKRNGGNVTC